MRFVVVAITMVFLFAMLAVYWTNADTTVDVVLGGRTFEDVHLWGVILGSMLAGCLLVGIVSVIEGAVLRFRNSRLEKRIRALENEMHYLRTQPPTTDPGLPPAEEPDEATESLGGRSLPSAPVYHVDDDRDDDELYTGGRAV